VDLVMTAAAGKLNTGIASSNDAPSSAATSLIGDPPVFCRKHIAAPDLIIGAWRIIGRNG
jgi:hypothetical protein